VADADAAGEPGGAPGGALTQGFRRAEDLDYLVAMPRLGSSEPDDRTPRTEHDRFLFVVKIAALAVVAGVVGGVLLLSGGGGTDEVAATNPAVPTITDPSSPRGAAPPPAARPAESLAAPAVGTQTAEIKVRPRATPTRQAPVRPPGRFVRVGQPCDEPGAIAFTRRFEPVVCRPDGRQDRSRWQRLF
jgi:hypothetical protein